MLWITSGALDNFRTDRRHGTCMKDVTADHTSPNVTSSRMSAQEICLPTAHPGRDGRTIYCRLISLSGLGRNRPYMSVGANTRLDAPAIALPLYVSLSRYLLVLFRTFNCRESARHFCQFQLDGCELNVYIAALFVS